VNELGFPFLLAQQIKEQLNVFLEGYHGNSPQPEKFKYIPSVRDKVGNISTLGTRLNQITSLSSFHLLDSVT